MSNQNSRSQWSAGRFIKTLAYFDAIPILSWLQRLTKNPHNHQNADGETKMGLVLVAGVSNNVTKQVVKQLSEGGYQVRLLVADIEKAQAIFGNDYDFVVGFTKADLTLAMNNVQAVVCCLVNDTLENVEYLEYTNLVEAASSYFNATPNNEKLIFDFQNPSADLKNIWGAVDDVVMGGVSESEMCFLDNTALFAGNVSTANSGGFASIRTKNFEQNLNLAGYEGIKLRVKGDGKRYKFFIRTESKWDGIAYSYSFDTVNNTWLDIGIPFSELIAVFRAKTLTDAPRIDSSNICSFQIMLSKFEYDGELNPNFSPGGFALQIESIKAYGGDTLPRFVLLSSSAMIYEDNLKNSGITYTIIKPSISSEQTEVKPLIFTQGDRCSAAELCVQVLAQPQACNVTFAGQ